MKTKAKRWRAVLGLSAALLGLLGAGRAMAAGPSDSITVTITPTASYTIAITSMNASMNLGSVGVNTSTYTATASTLSVSSSYQYTGLSLQAIVTSPGGTPWTLVSTAAAASNAASAWVVFTDTSVINAPAPATVLTSSNDVIGTASYPVGAIGSPTCPQGTWTGAGAALFQSKAGSGLKPMECLPTSANGDTYGSQPHMFLYFQTPPAVTDTTHAQLITFLLTASAPQ